MECLFTDSRVTDRITILQIIFFVSYFYLRFLFFLFFTSIEYNQFFKYSRLTSLALKVMPNTDLSMSRSSEDCLTDIFIHSHQLQISQIQLIRLVHP